MENNPQTLKKEIKTTNNSKKQSESSTPKQHKQQPKNQNPRHKLTKRPPAKPCHRKNDIFVTNKSNFNAQFNKCLEILQSDTAEVFLHCIGHAITRCINLALKLVAQSNGLILYEANTSTIQLIDDLHPLCDDDDFGTRKRMNSGLHVRVFRLPPAEVPKKD